jgi:RHS repeat-associated protein
MKMQLAAWQDVNNYYKVYHDATTLRVSKVVDGAETVIASGAAGDVTGQVDLAVEAVGDDVVVTVGGVTKVDAQGVLTDLAEGYVGLCCSPGIVYVSAVTLTGHTGAGWKASADYAQTFSSASAAQVHDARGNLTFDGVYYYLHDYRNRLANVYRAGTLTSSDFESSGNTEGWLKASPTGAPGSLIATYTYDGLNRRLRKVVDSCGALDTDQRSYYDGWRCVEDRTIPDDDPWAERLAGQYLWGGLYLDELVAFEADATADGDFDDAADTSAVVWHDALYSAVAVVSAKSGELGELLERYEYDAYGRTRIFDASDAPLARSAVALPFGFTGQRRDDETGLYYYKNRYYSPETGRFITRDPIGYVDGWNLYAAYFVPHATDPLGLVDSLDGISPNPMDPMFEVETGVEGPWSSPCPCTREQIESDKAGYEACTRSVDATYDNCQNAAEQAYDMTMEAIEKETAKLLADCESMCRSSNGWAQRTCTYFCKLEVRAAAALNRKAAFVTYQALSAYCLAEKALGYYNCDKDYPCHNRTPAPEKPSTTEYPPGRGPAPPDFGLGYPMGVSPYGPGM